MSLSRWARERMIADVGGAHVEPDAALVRAWQAFAGGLTADGVAGPKTLRALWQRHRPSAALVVERALAAAATWSGCVYSMPRSQGGVGWMADMDPLTHCDCSGFACQVMGLPKARGLHGFGALDLGSDGLLAGAGGLLVRHELADARPGDVIGWRSIWAGGGRRRSDGGRVGHVEVCVEVDAAGRIWTVGCASSNRPAVARADKTSLWRRRGAVAMRPAWYSEAG